MEELYEKVKLGEIKIEDLSEREKVRFLIMIRAETKQLQAIESEIMEQLKSDELFEKSEMEGIIVSRKTRTTISLLATADTSKIRELYPDICDSKNVLHQEKLSERVWQYLKEQPEAVEEVITVDAKKLHMVTKEYTTQKITPYIEVKGL